MDDVESEKRILVHQLEECRDPVLRKELLRKYRELGGIEIPAEQSGRKYEKGDRGRPQSEWRLEELESKLRSLRNGWDRGMIRNKEDKVEILREMKKLVKQIGGRGDNETKQIIGWVRKQTKGKEGEDEIVGMTEWEEEQEKDRKRWAEETKEKRGSAEWDAEKQGRRRNLKTLMAIGAIILIILAYIILLAKL